MRLPAFTWMIMIPVVASPLIYLIGHFGNKKGGNFLAARSAMVSLVVTWIAMILVVSDLRSGEIQVFSWGDLSLVLDGIALLLALLTLLLGTLTVVFSRQYVAGETGQEKFYALLTAMVGVMIGLGCATDLFNLWIWFEAMAVCSYMLVAFYHSRATSLEAGIKYLVQSAAGSVLVLLGIGLVLARTGTLDLRAIALMVMPDQMLLIAGILFVAGYGVKTALVPLHTWLPDAHSQAPSGISAMLSGVVIEAGMIALLRSISPLIRLSSLWGPLLIGCGMLNMVMGNLLAFRQSQVKRMLAYSSLTHVGYMLVGLGFTFYLSSVAGAQGGLFHLLNHGLMKGLAFLAAGSLLYCLHISVGDHRPLLIEDLAGAARRYPLAALALSLAVLSLGGLPPFAGFMSKWVIFKAGFESSQPVLWLVVGFVALNSVFSLAYYAPVVNLLYRRTPSDLVLQGEVMSPTMMLPLLILAAGIVVIGVWPSLMDWITGAAGQALLAGTGM